MGNLNKKEQDNKQAQETKPEVVEVEPQIIEDQNQQEQSKVKIDTLNLNIITEPLKKRYQKHYKDRHHRLVFDLALIAVIVVLAGVLISIIFFSLAKKENLIDFRVSSNPQELVNGQQAEFKINYQNTTKQTLSEVKLVLQIPESLHNITYSLEDFDPKTHTIYIGDLAPQAHGEFTVKGLLLGNYNQEHAFLALINYKNKYSQTKEEFFQRSFTLSDSVLATEINLPLKVVSSSPFATKIKVTNNSEIDLEQIQVKMLWPQDYVFKQTSLKTNLGNNLWALSQLEQDQTTEFDFTGQAFADQPQNKTIQVQILAYYDGQQYILAQEEATTFVDFSKFKISLTGLENIQATAPGERLVYTLNYENQETYSVYNLELGIKQSGIFAAKELTMVNQKTYPELKEIKAGQSGSIQIPATTKSVINYTPDQKTDFKLISRAVASFDDPEEKSRITVQGKPATTLVNSKLSLNTSGIFFSAYGDQLGVGSVPPIVDEYTSYYVVLKPINSHHKIENIKITATVPAGVEFTNNYNVSAGHQIIYHQDTKKIEWTISSLEAFAGRTSSSPEVSIELGITPTTAQIGTSPVLLTDIKATATDSETKALISTTGKSISTAIFPDESLNKVIE